MGETNINITVNTDEKLRLKETIMVLCPNEIILRN